MKPIILKLFIIFVVLILLHSCYIARLAIYNYADVRDYKKFPERELCNRTGKVFRFHEAPVRLNIENFVVPADVDSIEHDIMRYMRKTKTTGFLIIRNDTILYYQTFGKPLTQIYPSFSVSKSFIGALVYIAIEKGYIRSMTDRMVEYLPYWQDDTMIQKITVEHLMMMRSGIDFTEKYKSPFSGVAKLYYGRNLEKFVRHLKVSEEPGKVFRYRSVNTLLLSMILQRATGKPTHELLLEELIEPLGFEYCATVNLDRKKGIFKAYCCLNATLVDFAKLGRLYLHWGEWQGQAIVARQWIERVRNMRPEHNEAFAYVDQWFVGHEGDFAAMGFLGQYIYVYPEKNVIMVRTGARSHRWIHLLRYIAKNYL